MNKVEERKIELHNYIVLFLYVVRGRQVAKEERIELFRYRQLCN